MGKSIHVNGEETSPKKRGSQECATPDSPGRVYCTCRYAQASVYLISLSELVTVVDNLCILYKVGECGLCHLHILTCKHVLLALGIERSLSLLTCNKLHYIGTGRTYNGSCGLVDLGAVKGCSYLCLGSLGGSKERSEEEIAVLEGIDHGALALGSLNGLDAFKLLGSDFRNDFTSGASQGM